MSAYVALIFENDLKGPLLLAHIKRNVLGLIESGYVVNGDWSMKIKFGGIIAEEVGGMVRTCEWSLTPCREIEIPDEMIDKGWNEKLDYAYLPDVRSRGILRQASDYHQTAAILTDSQLTASANPELSDGLRVIKELKASLINDNTCQLEISLAQNPMKSASSIIFDTLTLVETRIKALEAARNQATPASIPVARSQNRRM